jgi:hypothetical protein
MGELTEVIKQSIMPTYRRATLSVTETLCQPQSTLRGSWNHDKGVISGATRSIQVAIADTCCRNSFVLTTTPLK